jgi:catechol 2,3-dioxygenase-like lactoylglutathione lyase family enzyme
MMTRRFVGTHLVTADVPRLTHFYELLLDQPAAGSEEYMAFRLHDITLAICSQCAVDVHLPGAATLAGNHSLILDFEVDDVDAERRRLAFIVPDFVLEPITQPWGNRSMMFRDPDGNLINVYTRSHAI